MKNIWIIPLLVLGLCAFTPVYEQHDTSDKVDKEIKNIYDQAQSNQFKMATSTPNFSDMKDGEIVIFSSGAIKLMFRSGQDIYAIGVSCITIRR